MRPVNLMLRSLVAVGSACCWARTCAAHTAPPFIWAEAFRRGLALWVDAGRESRVNSAATRRWEIGRGRVWQTGRSRTMRVRWRGARIGDSENSLSVFLSRESDNG